jgi:hypothetical protein
MPLRPYVPTWRGRGEIYLYFTVGYLKLPTNYHFCLIELELESGSFRNNVYGTKVLSS